MSPPPLLPHQLMSESKKMAGHLELMNLPVPSQVANMSNVYAWWLMADLAIV